MFGSKAFAQTPAILLSVLHAPHLLTSSHPFLLLDPGNSAKVEPGNDNNAGKQQQSSGFMSGFLPSIENFAKGTAATAATLGTLGAGLLWYGQNYLIYPSAFPAGSRTEVALPSDYGMPYEDVELKTPDNVLLKCYALVQRKGLPETHQDAMWADEDYATEDEFIASRPTVIMFHGNGGNHGHRLPLAKIFFMRMRCNVFMLSYRGYGLSEGSPSEKGIVHRLPCSPFWVFVCLCLQTDAQTALNYVLQHPVLAKSFIILYGQSIGGAVSIDLASKNPTKISALILENTFTSLPNLVPHALPVLGPVSFLCHQKWDSINKIPLIPATTPMLMLSGMEDEIVPKEHMRALWEAVARRGEKASSSGRRSVNAISSSSSASGVDEVKWDKGKMSERAKYMEFEHGGHNDTCVQPGYWGAINEFVTSLGEMKGVKPKTSVKKKSSPRGPDSAQNPYRRRNMAMEDHAAQNPYSSNAAVGDQVPF
ncbi:hypothetical protein EST38_g13676 [Candolleomyces aberdarensis]|uniref:AB hydrolase-1 domain-containing protein n=1 Tax=Candolleomyces aberdarensis TaxID=2316362 RepID=A0A4V1Q1N2_9AGAR|nr:hypothetical protein EST38_g13676 [Candolleomyces aberdarensis]